MVPPVLNEASNPPGHISLEASEPSSSLPLDASDDRGRSLLSLN